MTRPEQNASRSANSQSNPGLQTQDQVYRTVFFTSSLRELPRLHSLFIMLLFDTPFQRVSIGVPLKVQHFIILLSLINVKSIIVR